MKMKRIIIFILLGLIAASCNNDDDDAIKGNVGKNEFRVKTIRGTNAQWGDFTLTVSYRNEEMDSMYVYNATDTLAYLSKEERPEGNGYDYASTIYHIYNYVANISADSIQKLEDKYGVEVAKDSIPLVSREVFSSQVAYENGEVWLQILTAYVHVPEENQPAQYLKEERNQYMYEYHANGSLDICRMFHDTFDTSDADLNNKFQTRDVRKLVFNYDRGLVSDMEEFRAEDEYGSEASYVKVTDWNFIYTGDRLTAANDITYSWNGNAVSITREGNTVRYTLNANGYPTRIDYPNGDYLEVTYEAGNGNFSIFSPLLEQNFGIPYIR